MARNRMVKPEFWSSKSLRKVSLESRLLFIGIWNFCDDYGVCLDCNRKILGEIFPLDNNISEKKIEKWKKELIGQNLLLPISYDSTNYLIVKSWKEHQKVDNPSTRRWLEDSIQTSLVNEYLKNIEGGDSESLSKGKEKERDKEESIIPTKKSTIEERMTEFELELKLYLGEYPPEMLKAFYEYWSEPNLAKTKMRKELEETWDTKRRLNTWKRNQKQFGNKNGIYDKHITDDKLRRISEDIANDPDLKR